MTDKTTTDSAIIPKAEPAPGHGCCGGDAIADPMSQAAKAADSSALGRAKAADKCCCGGGTNKSSSTQSEA